MFEEQEQKEGCRCSTLSKEVETGRDSIFKATEAPVKSLACILSGWKSLEGLSRVVV